MAPSDLQPHAPEAGVDFEGQALRLFERWVERLRAEETPESTPGEEPHRPRGRVALRIWELPHKLLCPVIGTCLPMAEVRRLALKHELIERTASDYEAHVSVIQHCKTRTALAQDVQRVLDRRHIAWLGRFERLKDEAQALALWRDGLARGEAAGALWGVVSARAATDELLQTVYEDIHMFSHQMGAGVRADLKRIHALEAEVAVLKAELKRSHDRAEAELAARAQRIRFLEGEAERARRLATELQTLQAEIAAWQRGERWRALEAELAALRAQRDDLTLRAQRGAELQARLQALEAEYRRLREALRRAQDERDALERLIESTRAEGCEGCAEAPVCGGQSLPWRRLLCVGGQSRLHVHYRNLVERIGAELTVHDGGREEAMSRLPELLAQADAVLCPTDAVSHAAYYQVKRFCKQYGKPCVWLRGGGLASFAEGLRRLTEGRFDLGPATLVSAADAERAWTQ
ncbi:MAG: DUF2325 domain-containing protein [Thiobacillaceae bacterium]|nr:DUF2325 domain-containing protein [Thiobacillaceae bacterium]